MKSRVQKTIIQLDEVWKTYEIGDIEVQALKGISFDVKIGEFLSITGASGSGKSTMMYLVGALDLPTRGDIYLDNKNVSKMSESILAQIRGKKIGFVFQQFNLINNLTAL